MAAPMVDYNPSFTFQHSSPLDTLAHRTSSRRAKGAKLLAPQPAAPAVSDQNSYLSSYLPNVTTPPRRQLQQQHQMSPPSPLLHTQFRTSAISYDPHNSFLDTSTSSMHRGDESQEVEYSYKDDDASVYSRPSMLPLPHPQDRHSLDPNLAPESWEDAYGGTADPDPPPSQNPNAVLAFQANSPESSLPTVIISTADTPLPIMQPTRGCKVPIAAPTKFNFSRPGRPPTLPPEDLKRQVLERNAGRHPPHQRAPPLIPLPPNPTGAHSSKAVISGSSSPWMPNRQPYLPDNSLNTRHVNYTPSSSSIPNQLTPSPQNYPHHPDPISFSEHYNEGISQGVDLHTAYQSSRSDPPARASPPHSEVPHPPSTIPFGNVEGARPPRSTDPYSQSIDASERNRSERVRGYGNSYESDGRAGGVGGKQTEARPAGPQEVSFSSHSAPLHPPGPILRHDSPGKNSTWNTSSYGASLTSRSPNANGSPLPDYPNYSPSSSEAISRPSTSTMTSTTPQPTIALSREPPPRAVSPAASVYSQYSFYQLDSKSPSPTGSTSRFSPDSAGFHGPSDQTRPPLLSPSYTPPTRSPASGSRSPSPASTVSPAASHTPQKYLQLGIQHHEANRLKDSAMCFEKSAKENGGCGVGMVMWGLTLRHGWGCEKNEKLGFKWLQKAAESAVVDLEGNRKGLNANAVQDELVIAIYEVGQCFFQGWGVRKDLKMAVSYYTVAARLGDADAQQDLGFCLANGKGCKKDRKEAAKWYRAAIAQGASDVGMAWVYKDKFQ